VKPYFKVTTRPETYDGAVKIHFRCDKDTDKLILHSIGLILDNSTLSLTGTGGFLDYSNFPWKYDPVTSFLTIELEGGRMFRAGQTYTFSVEFQGRPQTNNLGFFRTSYNDAGTTKYLEICLIFIKKFNPNCFN
jgi:hypothetical protein